MQRSVESDEEDENSFSKEPEGMCYCIDQVKALTEFQLKNSLSSFFDNAKNFIFFLFYSKSIFWDVKLELL